MAFDENLLCLHCKEQLEQGRHGKAHSQLRHVLMRPYRGSMFGGHEETIYRCATCGAFIEHTNDKNEFAPFWYVVNDPSAEKP